MESPPTECSLGVWTGECDRPSGRGEAFAELARGVVTAVSPALALLLDRPPRALGVRDVRPDDLAVIAGSGSTMGAEMDRTMFAWCMLARPSAASLPELDARRRLSEPSTQPPSSPAAVNASSASPAALGQRTTVQGLGVQRVQG